MDRLVRHDRAQIEHRVDQMTLEDIARHVLGRRHVLERRVRKTLARELRLRDRK